jgi:ubiquitin-activating enzyme E1
MEEKEELYSRQIAAYGSNSMNKISKLKIMIYGLRGLGIEISKNIILAGPERVTIFDDNKITREDLGSNFYIEEKDIGSRRDETSLIKLSELNNLVKCDYLKSGNLEESIKEYDLLIITEIMEIDYIIKLNNICHTNKKGFIYNLVFGLSFYCFVDFGVHVITNLNNNEARKYFIKDIEKGKNTIITIDNEFEDFALNEDDFVIFKEIKGISQLLDGKKRKVKNCEDNKFEIEEDSSNYEDYIQGGVVEEIVENIIINNKSIEEMLNFPEQCESINQRNKELNLHLAFLSLHEFFKQTKKLPENNKNDFDKIFELAKGIYKKNQKEWAKDLNLDEDFLGHIFKFSKCEISPVCGYGGGVVSQEIIKYIGLYKPINQWFRAEFFGILDKDANHDIISKGTRYNDQILIF